MNMTEIRDLSLKELIERIDADTFISEQKHINHTISPMDNSSQLKKMRKDIARMKTELRLRELKMRLK
jgi:large subunit ribosomal protein L29